MGSVIMGALALAVLQGIVSRKQATANVGGFIAGAGKAVAKFLDPTVPAFSSTQSGSVAVASLPSTTPAPLSPSGVGSAPSQSLPVPAGTPSTIV